MEWNGLELPSVAMPNVKAFLTGKAFRLCQSPGFCGC